MNLSAKFAKKIIRAIHRHAIMFGRNTYFMTKIENYKIKIVIFLAFIKLFRYQMPIIIFQKRY